MTLSGTDLYLVVGGVVAFILLLLMLRFALRGGRSTSAQGDSRPGLGLDPRAGTRPVAFAGPVSKPAAPSETARQPEGSSETYPSYAPPGDAAGASLDRGLERDRVVGAGAAGDESPDGSRGVSGTASPGAAFASDTATLTSAGQAGSYEPSPEPLSYERGVDVVGRADLADPRKADPSGCPKCGGRFLSGEMEGPTLMIDGVSRDDFQPLLSARECCECGYLEFYTRPLPG